MSSIIRSLMVKVGADLTDFDKSLKRVSRDLKKTGKDISSTGAVLTKSLTLPVMALGTAALSSSISFESAFAGVRKTVDATEEQFAELSQGIRDMSKEMPMAANDIAAIAESAGQLGIQTENILKFSKTMADLGVATNLSGEDAATAFARFANITQMSQGDFDRLGSVIVDLGNNLATTERDIAEMGLRLAGAGTQIGLTEAQILSFAGALSSVGIEAQAGGSAFSKVFVNMQLAVETGNESLADFAKVAGMSVSDFQKAFKEDAAGAVTEFIKGLSRSEERGISAIKVLDDMGISEVRMRDALLRAAGASDVFSGALELGTKAWEENTALTKEAEQRYGTTQSKMEILRNKIQDVGITLGDMLIPAFTSTLDAVAPFLDHIKDMIKRFSELSPGMKRMSIAALGFATAIGPVLSITGKLTSTVGGLIGNLGKATKAISSGGGIVKALGALIGPAGVAVLAGAAIAGVAFAVIELRKRMAGLSPEAKILTDNIKDQKKAYDELKESQEVEIKTSFLQIGRTQELWSELQKLTDENGNVTDANKERAEYILNELNTALGLEMQLVDGQITGYKELQVEIGNLIKIQQAEAVLSAKRAEYEAAVTGWKERYNEQAALGLEIAEREKELTVGDVAYGESMSVLSARKKQLDDLKRLYAENEKIIKEYGETKDEYEKLSAAVTDKNYAEIERITLNYGTRLQRYVKTQNAAQAVEQESSLRRQADIAERSYRDIQRKVYMGEAGVTQEMADAAYEQWQLAETEYDKIGRSIPGKMQDGISEQMPGLKTEIIEMGIALQALFRNAGISSGKAYAVGLNQGRGPIKIDTSRGVESYFNVPSFDIGTPYVPRDMLAMVHKGERIVPADENKPGHTQSSEVVHSGTIRVEGVNSKGDLIGVAEIVAKQLDRDGRRRSSGVRFNPIVT